MKLIVLHLVCHMGLPWAACTPENAILVTESRLPRDSFLCSRVEEQKAPREISASGTYERTVCVVHHRTKPAFLHTEDEWVRVEDAVEADLDRMLGQGAGK